MCVSLRFLDELFVIGFHACIYYAFPRSSMVMSKPNWPSIVVGLYRAGVIGALIAAMLYLQAHYVSRREFEDYKVSHSVWGEAVIKRIDDRLARIETKLDRLWIGHVPLTNRSFQLHP